MDNNSYFFKIRQKYLPCGSVKQLPQFGGFAVLFLVMFFATNLSAQYSTRLAGVVHDSVTDQPLTGVIVELTDFHS